MKTNLKLMALLAAFAGLTVWAAPAAAGDAKDGKATFTELKCNSCHAVSTQGIAAVEEEAEGEDEDAEESKPSDLAGIGAKHDAKWFKDWLNKKAEKDGKTHRKKFAGTGAQLNTLADWLATLKDPAQK